MSEFINSVKSEYVYDPDIFCKDDERVVDAKSAMRFMSEDERAVLVAYSELRSFRKIASLMGRSHYYARQSYIKAKRKLLNIMNYGKK